VDFGAGGVDFFVKATVCTIGFSAGAGAGLFATTIADFGLGSLALGFGGSARAT
jgi:hypothetical protein